LVNWHFLLSKSSSKLLNFLMPNWKCPKCGSKATYVGTELQQKVSGSGGGPSVGIIGNELGDSGITPMMGISSKINVRSETVEVSVRKCKKCDTLIGAKDKHYALIDSIKAERREFDRAAKKELASIKAAATKNKTKQQNASSTDETEKFQVKNICKCGMAVAQLVSENKVMIFGGSSEEKEAARQWVEENHPEYEIT